MFVYIVARFLYKSTNPAQPMIMVQTFSRLAHKNIWQQEKHQQNGSPHHRYRWNLLNNFLRQAGDGRVSPIRSLLCIDVNNIPSPTAHYYRRKGVQAVQSVLDAIAPGQKRWLLQQVMEAWSHTTTYLNVNVSERTVLSRLVILYNEASNWYTR